MKNRYSNPSRTRLNMTTEDQPQNEGRINKVIKTKQLNN